MAEFYHDRAESLKLAELEKTPELLVESDPISQPLPDLTTIHS